MRKNLLLALLMAGTLGATLLAAGQEQAPASSASPVLTAAKESAPANTSTSANSKAGASPSAKAAVRMNPELSWRVEGEKRFHANCGRCHAAPQKFPPRAMATIIRHMRVRATITDEDMRLILKYMTE